MINDPRILDVKYIQSPILFQPSHHTSIAFLIGYILYAQIEIEYDERDAITVVVDRQVVVHANAKSLRRGRRKIRRMVRKFESYLHIQHKPATDLDFIRKVCGFHL